MFIASLLFDTGVIAFFFCCKNIISIRNMSKQNSNRITPALSTQPLFYLILNRLRHGWLAHRANDLVLPFFIDVLNEEWVFGGGGNIKNSLWG